MGRRRPLVALGCQQQVLGARDLREHLDARRLPAVPQRPLDVPALGVREQPVDHPAHIALVVDRVALGAAEHRCVLAQQPRAHGVKRRRGHRACDRLAEQVREPEPQLSGGADTEGDCEDLPRLRAPGHEEIRSTVGQRLCLAGTRAGEQQQWTAAVSYGLCLFGSQIREQAIRAGRRVLATARFREGHRITSYGEYVWLGMSAQSLRLRRASLRPLSVRGFASALRESYS
jgi:hypothetical protein